MPKKNFLRIPKEILERINQFEQDDVVVACAKHVTNEQVGAFASLGLKLENGEIVTTPPFLPSPAAGRYSKANVEGREVVRKDLPKYTKSFPMEAPDWGGYSTHTVWMDRDVYHRDFFPPKEVELAITVLERREGASLIKFAVNEVINRRTPNFEDALFYNLNILQENVGAVDVYQSEAKLAEYAASVRVDWEILPPGTSVEQIIATIKARGNIELRQEATMRERLTVMRRLSPAGGYVVGTTGFARYFGAKFGDDFVAFENIRYGNALYIMRENWRALSQKSRMELLAGNYDEVTRIEHRTGWDDTLTAIVEKYKSAKQRGLI